MELYRVFIVFIKPFFSLRNFFFTEKGFKAQETQFFVLVGIYIAFTS